MILRSKAIALTLSNEYTDWSLAAGGAEHAPNLMDAFVDLLGDVLVVAPLLRSANLQLEMQAALPTRKGNLHSQDWLTSSLLYFIS